jgi:hypothetical protein
VEKVRVANNALVLSKGWLPSATSGEEGIEEGNSKEDKKGGKEMNRIKISLIKSVLVVVVAIVILMAARYFGLWHGPVSLGGQVVSLVL